MLERAWDAFRTYACDPGAPDRENINIDKGVELGWAHDRAGAIGRMRVHDELLAVQCRELRRCVRRLLPDQ